MNLKYLLRLSIILGIVGLSLGMAAKPRSPFDQKSINTDPSVKGIRPPSQGPENAPVTIVEYMDFKCPYCSRAARTMQQIFDNNAGKVRWEFHHFPLRGGSGRGSFLIHEASMCADEQEKFWPFHDAIFSNPGISGEKDLTRLAGDLGLDINRFRDCLRQGKYRDYVLSDREKGLDLGVEGTPTYFINDFVVDGAYPYEYFQNVINMITNTSPGQQSPAKNQQGADLIVDAKTPENRPDQGPEDAPVTLIEFGDFACPYCKEFSASLDLLMQKYNGKIRRIWRHFPLDMHPHAERIHEASACAAEQSKFWDFYQEIFKGPIVALDDAALTKIAARIGVETDQFQACLESGHTKSMIREDVQDGRQIGVRGTPTVIINGKMLKGARSYEELDTIVQNILKKT